MSAPFIAALLQLVDGGDYGSHKYDLQKVKSRIPYSKGRYVLGAFSWDVVMKSEAPALWQVSVGIHIFRTTSQHLFETLGTTNIRKCVEDGAREVQEGNRYCPSDQYSVQLPNYYSKLRFQANDAYAYKSEYWLQSGNRESPAHVDHGRVVSYMSPCAKNCFKIWVVFLPASQTIQTITAFNYGNKEDSVNRMLRTPGSSVLIQRPGVVVCLNNLVFRSVLLAYPADTAEEDKWGGVVGDVVVYEVDRVESFRYATKPASGAQKSSQGAWESLLSAYCTMEGRDYHPQNFESEKKLFYEKQQLPAKSEKPRAGANAKKERSVS